MKNAQEFVGVLEMIGAHAAAAAGIRDAPIECSRGLGRLGDDPRYIRLVRDIADDGMETIRQHHKARETNSPVVLYLIDGGGHTWPGSQRAERMLGQSTLDFDANEIMWEFLVEVTSE